MVALFYATWCDPLSFIYSFSFVRLQFCFRRKHHPETTSLTLIFLCVYVLCCCQQFHCHSQFQRIHSGGRTNCLPFRLSVCVSVGGGRVCVRTAYIIHIGMEKINLHYDKTHRLPYESAQLYWATEIILKSAYCVYTVCITIANAIAIAITRSRK